MTTKSRTNGHPMTNQATSTVYITILRTTLSTSGTLFTKSCIPRSRLDLVSTLNYQYQETHSYN